MRNQRAWICLECGKTVYFPSVDPETRQVICTHCRKTGLVDIPQEQLVAPKMTA